MDVDRVRGVSSSARHMLAIIPKSVKERLIRGRCMLLVKPRCPNARPRSELILSAGLGPDYALDFKFTKSTSRPSSCHQSYSVAKALSRRGLIRDILVLAAPSKLALSDPSRFVSSKNSDSRRARLPEKAKRPRFDEWSGLFRLFTKASFVERVPGLDKSSFLLGGIYRIDLDLSRVPHVRIPRDIT